MAVTRPTRRGAGRLLTPEAIALVGLTGLALALRITLLDGWNKDVEAYTDWLNFIREHGGFHAFRYEVGDYTPLFPYLLFVLDHLLVGASDTTVIKVGPIVADLVCAAFAYKIVRLRHPVGMLPTVAFGVILFAPTVAINSGYWGQTDMIWTAALVAALYFILAGRPLPALVFVGVAFAFKLQAVFFAPFLLLLALRRVLAWKYFLLVPAVYLVSIVPAKLAGGSTRALLTVYFDQTDRYSSLTLNAPTVFQWLPADRSDQLSGPGTVWGVSVVLLLVLACAAYLPAPTPTLIVALATASVLVTPFVLPKMHERYMFAADVFTILLAFWVPRLLPVAILVQLVSLFSYWPFLFDDHVFAGPVLAVAELAAVTALLLWIGNEIRRLGGGAPVPLYGAGSPPG
jgi:Gpi18-like mannosyltransferase